ncbi:hypothetical protein SVIOM342S_02681 [Streptomyces violaceorubidus]
MLIALRRNDLRFYELRESIRGMSEKMLAQTLRVLVEDAQGLAEGRADDAAAGHVRAHRVRPGHRGAADGPVRPDHPAPVGGRHALAGPRGRPAVSGVGHDVGRGTGTEHTHQAHLPNTPRTDDGRRACMGDDGRRHMGRPSGGTGWPCASGWRGPRGRGARRRSPHHWSRCTAPTRRRCTGWARGWRTRRDWYLAPELPPTLFDGPGRGGPLTVAGTDGPLPRSDGRPHPQIRGGGSLITDGGIVSCHQLTARPEGRAPRC